jgi:hypothetical protein
MLEVVVHTITMGDVEDPDLYVADPIYKWQQTDQGKWVMEKSVETPKWYRSIDPHYWGYKYHIHAYLTPEDHTFWKLKYE